MSILTTGAFLREQDAMSSGANMFIKIYPTTKSTPHASAANRTVRIQLENQTGQVHEWYNGPLTLAVTKSSSLGTVSLPGGTTQSMVNGVLDVVIAEGGTWAAADNNTLTVTYPTIMGAAVTGSNTTSVETMS